MEDFDFIGIFVDVNGDRCTVQQNNHNGLYYIYEENSGSLLTFDFIPSDLTKVEL